MSSVCRKPFTQAESWNSCICTFLTCELHHFCAGHYLLLIGAREHSQGINKYRGKNGLSSIPLPCLQTKKKLTCLPLTAEAVTVCEDVMFM